MVEPQKQQTDSVVDTLLEPIAGDNPAGENLRYEGTYDAIQEARREDDPTLPQGVWKTDLKKADWLEVENLCRQALISKTKDLQIAAWLAEAWIRRHGLSGAESSFKLLRRLCHLFWTDLYPPIDEDDLDSRISPFEWLNRRVSITLKAIPITQAAHDDDAGTWLDWETTLRGESFGDTEEGTGGDDVPSAESPRAVLLARISATSTDFYRDLSAQVSAAQQALQDLDQEITGRCGDKAAPSFGELRAVLEGAKHVADRILKEREIVVEPRSEDFFADDVEDDQEDDMSDDVSSFSAGPITSRREAYRCLVAASDYLMKREPHSPAPYLVRRAIKWGRMSLAELLTELLRNNADLPTVYTLLGIQQDDSLEDKY